MSCCGISRRGELETLRPIRCDSLKRLKHKNRRSQSVLLLPYFVDDS